MGSLKIGCGLAIGIISFCTLAKPEFDNLTICYAVKNDSVAYKAPCIITNTGGGGFDSTSYEFKNKKLEIVRSFDDEGNEIITLNNQAVFSYMRDAFFKKTNDESSKKFFCYKQKNLDFCAQQSN